MGFVPVVDLRRERAPVAAAIDAACRGFLQIVGHGVDPVVEDGAWAVASAFFDLPLAEKLAVSIPPGDAYGYGPFQVERLAASLGEDAPPDLKETFSIGPFDPAPPGLDDPAAAFVWSPNRWPAAPPDMAATCRAYNEALADLAARVMSLMATGLGLAADHFEPFIDHHTSALRMLRYPDLHGRAVAPGQQRAGAHADYGTLTLLRQDAAPGGLQLRDVAGEWHAVAPVDGAYVVNVGDALARWTNDRWRSTVHRVVAQPPDAPADCTRQSIAFFHDANWDAELTCRCLEPGETARYEPVTAGRHLMAKFLSTQDPPT